MLFRSKSDTSQGTVGPKLTGVSATFKGAGGGGGVQAGNTTADGAAGAAGGSGEIIIWEFI